MTPDVLHIDLRLIAMAKHAAVDRPGLQMEEFEDIALSTSARIRTSWLYALTKAINTEPSLYLKAGAIHGC
ncbi:MAG: hypothetical protein AAFO62_06020, partial [Pseudomonadota bacterium]